MKIVVMMIMIYLFAYLLKKKIDYNEIIICSKLKMK